MTGGDDAGRAAAVPRPGRRRRGRGGWLSGRRGGRVAGWLSVVLAAVLVAAGLAVYVTYRSVWDSVGRVRLSDLGHRPGQYTGAVNVLVFGYDQRSGLTRREQLYWHVGRNAENSSDTIMLVHLSPGRRRVLVLSIPRDTMVPVFQCDRGRGPDGTRYAGQAASPGGTEPVNGIYAVGGASCLVKTVEQVTGIRVDHFIGLGLAGFVRVVNDIGGVFVCLPVPVHDAVSGLRLSRGWHKIYGATALKFWRTRENLGTGSDLQRIQRDQYFMAALLDGITRSGLLSSPAKMWSVVGDLARSMTTDSAMTPLDLLHIAVSLKGVGGGRVQFLTAPNRADPADLNRVVFAQPQAGTVFAAIAHDRALPGPARRPRAGAGGRSPGVPPARSEVKVAVLNGSGVAGQAAAAGASLARAGFTVVSEGDAPGYGYATSVIAYPAAASLPAVHALQARLGPVTIRPDPRLAGGTIELITGSSYHGLAPAARSRSGSPGSALTGLSRAYGGITGSARMCSQTGKAAFTGAGTVNG